jgi:hypothetical protein
MIKPWTTCSCNRCLKWPLPISRQMAVCHTSFSQTCLNMMRLTTVDSLTALFLRHRWASTLTAFFVARALGRHFSNRPTCWSALSWLLELLLVGCGYSLLNSAHLSSACLLSSLLCLFERGWAPVNFSISGGMTATNHHEVLQRPLWGTWASSWLSFHSCNYGSLADDCIVHEWPAFTCVIRVTLPVSQRQLSKHFSILMATRTM